MQRCITCTKTKKGANILQTVYKYVGLTCKRLITPVKTCFEYLIHYFRSLLETKAAINYLYGLMDNILDRIR